MSTTSVKALQRHSLPRFWARSAKNSPRLQRSRKGWAPLSSFSPAQGRDGGPDERRRDYPPGRQLCLWRSAHRHDLRGRARQWWALILLSPWGYGGGIFPRSQVVPYILAQLVGAIAASAVLLISLGGVANRSNPAPERQLAAILNLGNGTHLHFDDCHLRRGIDCRAPIGFAGLAIGMTLGLSCFHGTHNWG